MQELQEAEEGVRRGGGQDQELRFMQYKCQELYRTELEEWQEQRQHREQQHGDAKVQQQQHREQQQRQHGEQQHVDGEVQQQQQQHNAYHLQKNLQQEQTIQLECHTFGAQKDAIGKEQQQQLVVKRQQQENGLKEEQQRSEQKEAQQQQQLQQAHPLQVKQHGPTEPHKQQGHLNDKDWQQQQCAEQQLQQARQEAGIHQPCGNAAAAPSPLKVGALSMSRKTLQTPAIKPAQCQTAGGRKLVGLASTVADPPPPAAAAAGTVLPPAAARAAPSGSPANGFEALSIVTTGNATVADAVQDSWTMVDGVRVLICSPRLEKQRAMLTNRAAGQADAYSKALVPVSAMVQAATSAAAAAAVIRQHQLTAAVAAEASVPQQLQQSVAIASAAARAADMGPALGTSSLQNCSPWLANSMPLLGDLQPAGRLANPPASIKEGSSLQIDRQSRSKTTGLFEHPVPIGLHRTQSSSSQYQTRDRSSSRNRTHDRCRSPGVRHRKRSSSSSITRALGLKDIHEAAEELQKAVIARMIRERTPRLHPEEVERLKEGLPTRLKEVIHVSTVQLENEAMQLPYLTCTCP